MIVDRFDLYIQQIVWHGGENSCRSHESYQAECTRWNFKVVC